MTKCINRDCADCGHCLRFDPHAGFKEPVVYPNGTPDCKLFIWSEDDEKFKEK